MGGPYDRSCSDAETQYVVGEFNCSCVGISKFQAVCGGEKTLADVPDEDYFDACRLTDLMGVKAIEMLDAANKPSGFLGQLSSRIFGLGATSGPAIPATVPEAS